MTLSELLLPQSKQNYKTERRYIYRQGVIMLF